MQEAKHTPGPWHCGPSYSITADMPQDVDHKHFKGFDKPDYDGKYLIAESVVLEANRRLVAAAPDLLEELEATNRLMNQLWALLVGPKARETAAEVKSQQDRNNAALAKAKAA